MDSVVLVASLRAASISVGKSVAIVAVGWVVCKTRLKGGRQTVRDVTQTLVYVYNPCLSITNLISTLTLEKLLELWLLPVYSYILAAVGMLVGAAISSIFDPNGCYRPVVIASTACGNGKQLASAAEITVQKIEAEYVETRRLCRAEFSASVYARTGFSLPLSMAGALMFSVGWIREDPDRERLYTYIFLYVITAGVSRALAA